MSHLTWARDFHHSDSLDDFCSDLEQAANNIHTQLIGRRVHRYQDVRALLLSWEDDDLGCMDEIQKLGELIWRQFNIPVEDVNIWEIPSYDSQNETRRKIDSDEFLRGRENSDHLLILYYGGHASFDGRSFRWHA